MKRFAKLIALILVLILALSLAACQKQEEVKAPTAPGQQNPIPAESEAPATEAPVVTDAPKTEAPETEAPETEAPKTEAPETEAPETEAPQPVNPGNNADLVGFWQSEISWEQLMEMSGNDSEDGSMDVFFALVGDNNLCMDLEFSADGTLTFSLDRASAEAMVDAMFENLPTMLPTILGVSQEELEATLQAQGMTMDDFVELMIGQLDKDSMLEGFEDSSTTGTYVVDGDRIYVCEEGGTIDTNSNYMVYTLSGDTLTLVELVGSGEDLGGIEKLLPWVFTRFS